MTFEPDIWLLVTSPAGAVVKYCDVYICVCLSLREDISGTTCAIFTIFVHVAYVRVSVLLLHIDDRPHRLSAGKGRQECTARAKCDIRLLCSS